MHNYPSEVSQNAYGKSLIATNDLPINTIVQEFCGQVVDYETSKPSIRCHLLNYLDKQTGTWKWMNASTDAIYANHSCEPNCELKDCVLRTIKDVKKGQELTFVYNIGLESDYWDPVWSFKCACGSRNCQGEIDRYRKF